MRHTVILLVLSVFLLFMVTCIRKEDYVETRRLEDTIPGWFIKAMKLDYSTGKDTTRLMHEHLNKLGTLIDRFEDKNKDLHIMWQYYDFAGIIDKYRKHAGGSNPDPVLWYYGLTDNKIVIEERIDEKGFFSYTYEYPAPGVPWDKILPSEMAKRQEAASADGKAAKFLHRV